jgi:DNA-binding HxlR family transcriptional regulator
LQAPDYKVETTRCVFIGRMLSKVTDKWTVLIVRVLGRGPRRFNALRREVGEISQKVLASTLKNLEENGFVSRTVTPVKPPQVEYALTDLGREFLRPVKSLAEWVLQNAPRINAARSAYTAKTSARR